MPYVHLRDSSEPGPAKRRYEVLDGLGPDGLPVRPRETRGRHSALYVSAGLCALASLLYAVRPDAGAALTVVPVWLWLAPGLLLVLAGARRATRRLSWLVLMMWLVYAAVFVEEPRSLLRTGPWPSDSWYLAVASGHAVRVVSLNCAGGSASAAGEVASYHPDIVLLQETPRRDEVEALARRLYGGTAGVAVGPDGAILARGGVTPTPLPHDVAVNATRARVRLAAGPVIDVVSLRLEPPLVRADLWSPAAWTAQARNRRARRAQVRRIVESLSSGSPGAPAILGGDFNAPAGDAAMRPLMPRLSDTFNEAGRGWGDTGPNEFPVHRVDQVWASREFRPAAVFARRTLHSDHRLVVCDLLLNRYPPNN